MNEVIEKPVSLSRIQEFEREMSKVDGAMFGDCYPLTHSFADGLYVREIRVPKGNLVITKLFKQTHATFFLKGEVSIITPEGKQRMKAPVSLITKAGTKRIIYTHEDVVWVTVHATKETDLEKIEAEVIEEENIVLEEFEIKEIELIKSEE
jgi:hypothetical protein